MKNRRYGCTFLRGPTSNESKLYICVEDAEEFQVGVTVDDRSDRTTYGAVLYLDGQKVHGKKTFAGRSMFLGFKLGGGNYQSFTFSPPSIRGEFDS